MVRFLNRFGFWISLIICVAIYLVLAYKNPFGLRSTLSNLDPFPDTLFYSIPAWNLVHGNGLKMSVFGIEIYRVVPPAYGLFLAPFFKIFEDVRSFYFANILLGLITILFFCLSVKKIFKNDFLVLFLGFFLVTNFYFYMVSSILMAENISIAVVSIIFYLLIDEKMTLLRNILFTFLVVLLGLIKFSNVILIPIFLCFHGLKILFSQLKKKDKVIYLLVIVLISIGYILYLKLSGILSHQINTNPDIGFSTKYFYKNIGFYLSTLFGGDTKYLWSKNIFIVRLLSNLSLIGLCIGLAKKQYRKIAMVIFLTILGVIIFMSFFYYPDARYIQLIYPLFLLPIGFLVNLFLKKNNFCFGLILSGLIIVSYLFISKQSFSSKEPLIISLKKQIGLNLKHIEDPWSYLAVKEFNNFFDKKDSSQYLATFLPPFYVNYFYNGNYKYLPLSKKQEFSDGVKDFVNKFYPGELIELYKTLLNQGNKVYFSNFYVTANFNSWNPSLEEVKKEFNFELVKEGCYQTCNIYELSLKK